MRNSPTAFFVAQLEAAKLVQHHLFSEWKKAGQRPFAKVLSLQTDLRPKLDTISQELLAALSRAAPHRGRAGVADYLLERSRQQWQSEGISAAARERALSPFMK
jgi:hypothetical protein